MSSTRAVDVSIHAMSPACDGMVSHCLDNARVLGLYLIVDIEVLSQRITARGYGFVVWHECCVIERIQVHPIHHGSRHCDKSLCLTRRSRSLLQRCRTSDDDRIELYSK